MRLVSFLIALALLIFPASAFADTSPSIKGLWLTTDFPALTLRAGEETMLDLSLYNYGLAPQRAALSFAQKPKGWKIAIIGEGKPVEAAFANYDSHAFLSLKLQIPATAKPGDYKLVLDATGPDAKSELPILIHLEPPLKAKLTATAQLPVLKGSPQSSFNFRVNVTNESARNILANLAADAPKDWQVTFKQGYGTQELTSIPIKAGASQELAISVKPAPHVAAGKYPVMVHIASDKATVETRLTLDISGAPQLVLTGEDDRLSGSAYAGTQKSFPLVIRNTGTAAAHDISFSAAPPSGWKISFEPKTIDNLPAGQQHRVTALVTPAAKALNGDYMVAMNASGGGDFESADYRVTVMTSSLWGAVGVGVIGAALLVLVGAVGRFGRR